MPESMDIVPVPETIGQRYKAAFDLLMRLKDEKALFDERQVVNEQREKLAQDIVAQITEILKTSKVAAVLLTKPNGTKDKVLITSVGVVNKKRDLVYAGVRRPNSFDKSLSLFDITGITTYEA